MTVFLRVVLKPHFACFCLAGEDHGIEEKANGKVMVRNHHWTCHFTDLLHSVSLCSLHHWVQPGHLYHIWIFKADFHISLLVKLSVWTVHTLWCKICNRIFKMDVAKLWLSSISMFRSFFFFFPCFMPFELSLKNQEFIYPFALKWLHHCSYLSYLITDAYLRSFQAK